MSPVKSAARLVRIESMGRRGDGVGRTEDGPLYVRLTLPGETAKVALGEGGRGRLLELLESSVERSAPFCPHFGACGGCSLQHWQEAPYRAWKRELVIAALRKRGIETMVGELVDAHGRGRRRATVHARRSDDRLLVGFRTARSDRIVDTDRCPALVPELGRAFDAARDLAAAIGGGGPLDLAFTASDTGVDCAVTGAASLRPATRSRLANIARSDSIARLSVNGETVAEAVPPSFAFDEARVVMPPGSFVQPTGEGERTISEEVRHGVKGARRIADLFCGIGPFALRMARSASVSAFDSDANAVEALRQAARRTPRLKPVCVETRDLFREPLAARELAAFDAVIIDPPRQGAEAQMRELARSGVPTVVSVSCDPVTFARDTGILIAGGYRLLSVRPIDQFKWTPHVECVGILERR